MFSKNCLFNHLIKPLQRGVMLLLCILGLLLTACGGGSSGDSAAANIEETGEVLLSLTDGEGDFLTYVVKVTSIKLQRANGAVVETLPLTTTLDFAQYVEVTELLTIATVPAGTYTSAEMQLDFTDANITVQDEAGNPLQAIVVDSEGNPLTQTTVTIELGERDRFQILPGLPARVTLDFDLDASNDVLIEQGEATVTVNPLLLADTVLEEPKPFRLRGLLGVVAQEEEAFSLNLKPFRHRHGNFGSVRVHADGDTTYEIDGEAYAGEAGLAALNELAVGSAVITLGSWDKENRKYIADSVYAGTSVPWNDADIARGVVIGRVGNTLTVRGAVIELSEGQFLFNDDITITVSENTTVNRQLNRDETFTIADISIGSAIYAMGEWDDDRTLDATAGHVRIHINNLSGTVVAASPLAVDLHLLSGRRVALYDFSGTGIDEGNDADPENYEVATGSLSLDGLDLGDPVRARGFVQTFGAAPEDFIARTVINVGHMRGHMMVTYGPDGSETAVARIGDDGLLLNLEGSFRHHIVQAGIPTDLTTLAEVPVVSSVAGRGIFAIAQGRRVEVYTFFEDFISALERHLEDGSLLSRLHAYGAFDRGNATFTTKRLRVRLANTFLPLE